MTVLTGKPGLTAASVLRDLTPEQQDWLRHSEALWRKAHRIAAAHPEHDPSDLYHALRALERTPTERLRAGLQRGSFLRFQQQRVLRWYRRRGACPP
ncbi:MAG TPA: hypothetical protein VGD94_14145 [Vicinamibacterales bacterium]